MRIIGKTNLWKKSENLIRLHKYGCSIPKTIIVEISCAKMIQLSDLDHRTDYILRPSFESEDASEKSHAGRFTSIHPLSTAGVVDILASPEAFQNIFGGNGQHRLLSIIIQEYVHAEQYGVCFSRDPNNIFASGGCASTEEHGGITSGRHVGRVHLPWLLRIKLAITIWYIERIFWFPQDVEFCVQKNQIIVLQSRDITSLPITRKMFGEITRMSGIFRRIDNDEFDASDRFTIFILQALFRIIVTDSGVYAQRRFRLYQNDPDVRAFIQSYSRYLLLKTILSWTRKILFFQQTDYESLSHLCGTSRYSFDLHQLSILPALNPVNPGALNLKTRLSLHQERLKADAFKKLETLKELERSWQRNYRMYDIYHEPIHLRYGAFIWVFGGRIVSPSIPSDASGFEYIYPGVIDGVMTRARDIQKNRDVRQILLSDHLDIDLYSIIPFISGAIIERGSLLSHNAILLREHKIPSAINMSNFSLLVPGERIIV